ncbi:MAG TPA: EAL domain-containing protein [Rhodanobacteraceae bacterium]|jgi:diguanylate cyclase (GGDEF)-like protein|nr:EAL domain-containing protein [Rhodanobacteraceae bacterium]
MSDPIERCDPDEFARIKRRLERERAARREAETISERGLRRLYAREQELMLLQDIATAANLSQSVRDAFQHALTRICEFMAWPLGHAYEVVQQDGGVCLRSMTLWHVRDDAKTMQFRAATEMRDLAPGEGLPGHVYASGEPRWLTDVAHHEDLPRRSAALESLIRTACAFPIFVGEEVVAVFEFFSERALQPNQSLLALMPQVGIHLGRAVERKRAEDRLVHDASHDPLTGLPNRALFLERLNQSIAHARRKADAQFAVLFIDLDRFKIVNDSLGHLAGDRLITQVAARLKGALRREDTMARPDAAATDSSTLARLGGDEFTILLTDINDPSDAVRVANRVKDVLRLPFAIEGQDVYTSASIGIASSASGYESADAILRDADLAMYRAKALGKARWELFDREMHRAAMKRLALETDLRHALQEQEFVLHYQPIVSLQTNEVAGFEALVRWQKPGGELAFPGEFIEIMEDTGLIVFLGAWVLREACRAARVLQESFPREQPLSISVNVSPRQFAQPDLAAQVRAVIAEIGIDPHCLRLEITEGAMIGDMDHVAAVLRELKELGVRVSIDDFGTGYSSLSYLHSLPLDLLKIDRSFVGAMATNEESLQIVRTIMSLAHNLGMDVVAEGPEDAEQVARLRSIGCEFGQGYYFSKPVDLAGATDYLARSTRTSGVPVEAGRNP